MIKNHKKIKIGMWATSCCHRDLYQISSTEEIERIIDDWDEGISHEVWLSERDALLEIKMWTDDVHEISYIDQRLKDLEVTVHDSA